mgnify:CR=1 FL=1
MPTELPVVQAGMPAPLAPEVIRELSAEIRRLAAEKNAVILAHNHPSGSLEPSPADIALTEALQKALALIDVRVLDHFIVAGTATPLSFVARGLL